MSKALVYETYYLRTHTRTIHWALTIRLTLGVFRHANDQYQVHCLEFE